MVEAADPSRLAALRRLDRRRVCRRTAPKQAATLIGLHAGLRASMKPGAPLVETPPNPWIGLSERRELDRAPRMNDGRILYSYTEYQGDLAVGASQIMTDKEYLQMRQEQVEHQVYLHEMRYP